MAIYELRVNGRTRKAQAWDPGEPLLYVLRNQFDLHGPKFGCGLGQCGACTVLIDGQAVRSCSFPVSAAAGKSVTTIEGLGTPEKPDAVQAAFIAEQAAQCGYCTSGMIVTAKALLARNPKPTRGQIEEALDRNLCRCGTYVRIVRAGCARGARMSAAFSRAVALKAGGSLIVGRLRPAVLPHRPGAQVARGADATLGKPLDLDQVDSFLAIHADGSVTLFSGKVDLGTGVRIALRQMVAEELDIPVERIAMVEGDTALTPNQGGTGGSMTIARGGTQNRQAAATARHALLGLASAQLGVPPGELTIEDGVVRAVAAGKSVTFGALVGGKRFSVALDPKAPLKDPAQYKWWGGRCRAPTFRRSAPGATRTCTISSFRGCCTGE